MSLEQNLKDESANGVQPGRVSSFDDFLKELEEAEKNLSISDDLVVEVEDSFDDSFSTDGQNEAEEFTLETFAEPEKIPMPVSNNSASKQELQKLQVKVSALEEERAELRTLLQRRQNDFDSFRKRTERERSETFENILGKLSTQMLPVLDNLSRALESADQVTTKKSKEFELFIEGILLVNQQVADVLGEMGISPIASVGTPFDPHFHEAVATVESSEEPGTVMEQILTGYKIGKKVVRPAMVKVSVAPKAPIVKDEPLTEETASTDPEVSSEPENEE